jgi:hypothetical protein
VSGTIGNASITAGGTSETYIKTVNGSVNVNLDETAIVQIDATAGSFPAFFNSQHVRHRMNVLISSQPPHNGDLRMIHG